MKLVFTKGSSILSKFICWVFQDPVSHVALVFDDRLVFHSNLLGPHPDWLESLKETSELVYELDYPLSLEQEEQVYQEIIKMRKNSYDFKAALYFAYRGLLYRLLNVPIPPTNPADSTYGLLCVEVLKACKSFITLNRDLSITTPMQVYKELSK